MANRSGELAAKITKLEDDAKRKYAGFEERAGQLEKSVKDEVQGAVNKAQQVEKDVPELKRKMEEIEKKLKGKDDEVLELQGQSNTVKSQNDTIRRELDGMKECLLDLQATSDDTVNWMSGNISFAIFNLLSITDASLRTPFGLIGFACVILSPSLRSQSQLATVAHLSDINRNSGQQTLDAWRQTICYNKLSIDDRLVLVHSLLPNLTLSDTGLRLVVQHLALKQRVCQKSGSLLKRSRHRSAFWTRRWLSEHAT